jgi:hypothetical protein
VTDKCPQELADIIMRLLAKKPGERFGDCDELRIMLAGIGGRLRGEPTYTCRPVNSILPSKMHET